MYHMPIWYFNTSAFYETYPHKYNSLPLKAYYLLEASYWLQQAIVLVLQLEKPRKDFKELILHHFVTLSLIGLSWRFHFSWIGLAVFITMDVSDTFLALLQVAQLSWLVTHNAHASFCSLSRGFTVGTC